MANLSLTVEQLQILAPIFQQIGVKISHPNEHDCSADNLSSGNTDGIPTQSDLTNNKENAPLGYTAEELLKKKSKGEKGTEAQVYFQVKEKRLLYIIIIEYASEKIDLIIIIIIISI